MIGAVKGFSIEASRSASLLDSFVTVIQPVMGQWLHGVGRRFAPPDTVMARGKQFKSW